MSHSQIGSTIDLFVPEGTLLRKVAKGAKHDGDPSNLLRRPSDEMSKQSSKKHVAMMSKRLKVTEITLQ